MSANAMKERFHHVELKDKPMLYIECRVDRGTVPQGWYAYDVRGSDYDPGEPISVEDRVGVNHAGTLLSPTPITYPVGKDYLRIKNKMNFLGEEITIAEFCEQHQSDIPKADEQKYTVRPASPDEAGLFYYQSQEDSEANGLIGHVRMDFGHGGKEFWHTWHPGGPEELNSRAFKDELTEVVDALRKNVLSSLNSMRSFCQEHGGKIEGGYVQNYGYIVETEHYKYCLRCNPVEGDYQAYLRCMDKQAQQLYCEKPVIGKVSFANGERHSYKDADAYLKCIKEELEYSATSGFRFETMTDDPAVRKAVDDMVCDLCGEENPRQLEDYEQKEDAPNIGMTIGGMRT